MAQIAFAKQPIDSALGVRMNPVSVSVAGLAAGQTVAVTLTLANSLGGTILGGTLTRTTDATGTANFDDLYTYGTNQGQPIVNLIATASGDAPVTSNSFAIKNGPAYLNFPQTLTNVQAGANLGPIQVQVLENDGSVALDQDADTSISLYLDQNPGGATFVDAGGQPLAGNPTAQVSQGVASFPNVYLNKAGIGYTLGATVVSATAAIAPRDLIPATVQPATSNRFQVTAGDAKGLILTTGPQYAVAGQTINQAKSVAPYQYVGVTVQLVDGWGNPVVAASQDTTVTLALDANHPAAKLSGNTPQTTVNGRAVFSNLAIDTAGTGYQFILSAPGSPSIQPGTSAAFNVLPTAPAKLAFLTTFTSPVQFGVPIPQPIQVQVQDASGNPLTTDESSFVTISDPNSLLIGNKTARVVDGVATFDNLFIKGVKLDSIPQTQLQARFTNFSPDGSGGAPVFAGPTVQFKAGTAVALAFVVPAGQNAFKVDDVTAGFYMTAGGQPIQVAALDAAGNVDTDWSGAGDKKVSIGILQIGAHPQPTFIGNGPIKGSKDPQYYQPSATEFAHNGIATFSQLYIDVAGADYQLALGTPDLAFTGIATPAPGFTVNIGPPDHMMVLNDPGAVAQSASRNLVLGAGAHIPGYGISPLIVSVVDWVGNVLVDDNSTSISTQLTAAPPGEALNTLDGTTTVTVEHGIAYFDQLRVDQPFYNGIPPKAYVIQATGTSNPPMTTPTVSTSPFAVANTQALGPNDPPLPFPTLSFTQQPAYDATTNLLTFTVQLAATGAAPNAYDADFGPFQVVVVDQNDAPATNGPFLVSTSLPPVNGVASFNTPVQALPAAGGSFKIRAYFAYGAEAQSSDVFQIPATVSNSAAQATAPAAATPTAPGPSAALTTASPTGAGSTIVQVGLGSFTTDFDTIQAFPTYNLDAGGNPKPLSQKAFPPSQVIADNTVQGPYPKSVQPNVATGFTQVPQSNDWWSSVMFPRTPTTGPESDASGNQIDPMYPDPFAVDVNRVGTYPGIGLTHLTTLFTSPTIPFLDNATLLPPGQPQSLANPSYPGGNSFSYSYAGEQVPNNPRRYQDLTVGVDAAYSSAKVLAYSDRTVTLDWNGLLQATLGEGLPFAYFTAAAGQNVKIEMSDSYNLGDKTYSNSVYDQNGNPLAPGTYGTSVGNPISALRLHVQYTVQEFDPTGATNPDGSPKLVTLTIQNDYGVFLPSTLGSWTLAKNAQGQYAISFASAAGANYFSVASLPSTTDPSASIQAVFNDFRQRAYSFVTGSLTSFSYDDSSGLITTSYQLTTAIMEQGGDLINSSPMQALYYNLYSNLSAQSPSLYSPNTWSYNSARGPMELLAGPLFETSLQNIGTLPLVAPLNGDAQYYADLWHIYLQPYLKSQSNTTLPDGSFDMAGLLPGGSNDYTEAQAMFGATQLIPILTEIGNSPQPGPGVVNPLTASDRALAAANANRLLQVVKNRMSDWLSADDDQVLRLFYYQPNQVQESGASPGIGWQTLVGVQGFTPESESLNDEHFVAGYFIKTASIITMYDPDWAQSSRTIKTVNGNQTLNGRMGDIINLLVRNVANYSRNDLQKNSNPAATSFSFLRNFDPYQGHSWADGAANASDGNNQESSSESINFDAALIQWGEITGNKAIRDLGLYLYNTEINATNTYYYNQTPNSGAFPAQYLNIGGNRPNLSRLTNAGGAYSGFIGLLTSALAGIQMIPFSGSSYYLGRDKTFVQQVFTQAMTGTTQAGSQPVKPPAYLTALYPYYALAHPDTALAAYENQIDTITPINPANDPFDNNAFNIQWMSVLNSYGQVDPNVSANTASYQAFNKAGVRTLVAYNPDPLPRIVAFTLTQNGQTSPLATITVPGRTTVVTDTNGNLLASNTPQNFSLQTPGNRFFFSAPSSPGNQGTLLWGTTGDGESKMAIPAPSDPNAQAPDPTSTNALTFTLTGVSGILQGSSADASFELWLDPQYSPSSTPPTSVRLAITYNDGAGNTVMHIYNNIPLDVNPGFRQTSQSQIVTTQLHPDLLPLPAALNNGTITVQIWAFQGNGTPVQLRTDAAAEQGRVSFLDLPYNFTKIGGVSVDQIQLPNHRLQSVTPAVSAAQVAAVAASSSQVVGIAPTFGYAAHLDGSTATFAGGESAGTLILSQQGGLLVQNRFAAGDAGFASPFDFDSTIPGVQTLAASGVSQVLIVAGGGDAIQIGTPSVAASSLLASIKIINSGALPDTIRIDDSFGYNLPGYLVTNSSITTGDHSLNVQYDGGPFSNITLVSGQSDESIQVRSTRQGDTLTLDSSFGTDDLNIGAGSTRDILGDVLVQNSGGFTNLTVDNSQDVNESRVVQVTGDSVTGITPGTIRFLPRQINDMEIYGGKRGSTYYLAGSFAGSYTYLDTGTGTSQFVLGKDHTIDDTWFQGLFVLNTEGSIDRLTLDDSAGKAKNVTINGDGVLGMLMDLIRLEGLTTTEIDLGPAGNHVTVADTPSGGQYVLRLGDGGDTVNVQGLSAPLSVFGGGGNDRVSMNNDPTRIKAGAYIEAGAGDDFLQAGPRNDTLVAGPGQDQLYGQSGNATFVWNAGDGYALIQGGSGSNTLVVNGSGTVPQTIDVTPAGGRIRVQVTSDRSATLDVGSIQTLNINTFGTHNRINVTPLSSTAVTVQGGGGTAGSGDQILVNLMGAGNPLLSLAGLMAGTWTFATARPVTFSGIEYFNRLGLFAVAPGSTAIGPVKAYNPDGSVRFEETPYGGKVRGGIQVVMADVNGDGTPDLVVAPAKVGGFPILVYDGNTGKPMPGASGQLWPYGPKSKAVLTIAAGDVNGDGYADLIVGMATKPNAPVEVFSGKDGTLLNTLIVSARSRGHLRLAAGDLYGDGKVEIVAGVGFGAGPATIRVFPGMGKKAISRFTAFASASKGITLAVGDIEGDRKDDIIVGRALGRNQVRVFRPDGKLVSQFRAASRPSLSGVRLAVVDRYSTGKAQVLAGQGIGGDSVVTTLDPLSGKVLDSLTAYVTRRKRGLYLGG